jgi:hypothetical protein
MPQGVPGQADGYRLLAGDHVKLVVERPGERIPVNTGRWSHARIMALGSDKPAGPRLGLELSRLGLELSRLGLELSRLGLELSRLGLELNRPNVPPGRL